MFHVPPQELVESFQFDVVVNVNPRAEVIIWEFELGGRASYPSWIPEEGLIDIAILRGQFQNNNTRVAVRTVPPCCTLSSNVVPILAYGRRSGGISGTRIYLPRA